MLLISRDDVVGAPFPHVIKHGILPEQLFSALAADFPGDSVFAAQRDESGVVSSRTGSGFDIYRGDPIFSDIVSRSSAWREFAEFINSELFADTFREIFADHLDQIGLRIDIQRSHVDRQYIEPRASLAETATSFDKVVTLVNRVTGPIRTRRAAKLFTRLDIHKSYGGYSKPAHCDRPNRLCSLIIYFNDAERTGLEGGELMLFEHLKDKPVSQYERHPAAGDVKIVAKLKPEANLGVFFPCQNNSYHGVTSVSSHGVARDFLYINISARSRSIW